MNLTIMIIVSIIVIFVIGGIGVFVTLPSSLDFQKSDPINDYYKKNEQYSVLNWEIRRYDQNNREIEIKKEINNFGVLYWFEFEYDYDQWGNLIEEKKIDKLKNSIYVEKSEFDKYGKRVKISAVDENEELIPLQDPNFVRQIPELAPSSVEIFYDDSGNEIKRQYFKINGTAMTYFLYDYDQFDNKIELKKFHESGQLSLSEQWEYDVNGNEITYKTFPNSKKYFMETNSTYDDRGNKIVEKTRIHNDDIEVGTKTTETSYDDKDNKIVEKSTDNHGRLISFNTITYDDSGNILEQKIFNSNIVITSWQKFNYDQHHNLIESKEFDKNADIVSWQKFNYDQHHNLVGSKEFDIIKKTHTVQKSNKNNDDFQQSSNNTLADFNEIIITPSFSSSNRLSGECVLNCFLPNPVKVDVGTQITFHNTATVFHTFTSGNAYGGPSGLWDSGLLKSGTKYSIILNEKGTYEYYSLLSPWMTGKIVVGNIAGHQPPTANAGSDQTVDEGTTVFLSGSGIDPEGQSLTYRWTQINHPSVLLSGTSVPGQSSRNQNPTFTAPDVTVDTDLIFRLVVTDRVPPSAPKSLPELDIDTVTITIQNVRR